MSLPDHAEGVAVVDDVPKDEGGQGEADDEGRLQQPQEEVGRVGAERLCWGEEGSQGAAGPKSRQSTDRHTAQTYLGDEGVELGGRAGHNPLLNQRWGVSDVCRRFVL